MFKLKKLMLALACLFVFHSANAYEVCGLENDFVPWPWSDTYARLVIDQNWLLVDSVGNPQSELTLAKASLLWGKQFGLYSLQVMSLDGKTEQWGTARGFNYESSGELNFNVWTDGLKRVDGQSYKVRIGYWTGDSELLPLQRQVRLPYADTQSNKCSFFKNNIDPTVGLIVEIETKYGEKTFVERLYGLTKEPIYINE